MSFNTCPHEGRDARNSILTSSISSRQSAARKAAPRRRNPLWDARACIRRETAATTPPAPPLVPLPERRPAPDGTPPHPPPRSASARTNAMQPARHRHIRPRLRAPSWTRLWRTRLLREPVLLLLLLDMDESPLPFAERQVLQSGNRHQVVFGVHVQAPGPASAETAGTAESSLRITPGYFGTGSSAGPAMPPA
jgi:hypothetical protein